MKKSESISVTPSPEEAKPAPKSSNKPGSCKECGRDMVLVSRGLCGSCYGKAKKAGTLDKYPAAVRVYQTVKPVSEPLNKEEEKAVENLFHTMTSATPKKSLSMIGFTDFLQEFFPDVHQYVTDKANAELRDTEMQVIWYLRNAMEKGL